jgi:predicted DNA-binding ribbon-helix-helix protein
MTDRPSRAFVEPLDAGAAAAKSRDGRVNHKIQIGKRRTGVRFDRLSWQALHDIALRERVTIRELGTAINSENRAARVSPPPFALRCYNTTSTPRPPPDAARRGMAGA